MRISIRCIWVLSCALAFSVSAQDYPNRPIKLTIPFAPGGASDLLARTVADELGARLGQIVVPENRAGGATAVAASYVAKSKPDGYTVLFSTPTHAINAATSAEKLPYDPLNDFDFIGKIGQIGFVVFANAQLKVRDMQGLVAMMRSQPGKLQYGTAGNGTQANLWTEAFLRHAKVEALHVPYKGENEALSALLGGHLHFTTCTFTACAQHVNQPQLTALSVTTPSRFSGIPQLPTMAESGFPGHELVWYGFLAVPKGTPQPVIQKLNTALNQMLADENFRKRLLVGGIEAETRTSPAAVRSLVETELQRWRKVTN